jgi:hypothetical protein
MEDPLVPPPMDIENQITLGIPPAPVPEPAGNKHDDFYKYWDRFVRVKGKAQIKRESKGEGPSLDRDVEGRPGHKLVRTNTEGVTSR